MRSNKNSNTSQTSLQIELTEAAEACDFALVNTTRTLLSLRERLRRLHEIRRELGFALTTIGEIILAATGEKKVR